MKNQKLYHLIKYKYIYMKFVSISILFVSFVFGLFLTYLIGPETETIYVYPTPENIDNFIWQDKSNNCFTFEFQDTNCKDNIDNIINIPMQN
tara:strand:+ start:240 stop:515 length:276 start_codon:yes stop_codon:yes gene_type:complete